MFKKITKSSVKAWVFGKYFNNGSLQVETFQERLALTDGQSPSSFENPKTMLGIMVSFWVSLLCFLGMMFSDNHTFFRIAGVIAITFAVYFLCGRGSLNVFSFIVFCKVNSFTSFKSPVWTLRDLKNKSSEKGWDQVRKNLTAKEFETFEVVIQSFDGPIEDLIIAVKEIEKE